MTTATLTLDTRTIDTTGAILQGDTLAESRNEARNEAHSDSRRDCPRHLGQACSCAKGGVR